MLLLLSTSSLLFILYTSFYRIYIIYRYEWSTKGRKFPLILLRLHPLGIDTPSWYSAGSQRVKGLLEDPRRGFCLSKRKKLLFFFLFVLHKGVVCYLQAFDLLSAVQKECKRSYSPSLPLNILIQWRVTEPGEKSLTLFQFSPGAKYFSSQLVVD